jgi:hypothetical protein
MFSFIAKPPDVRDIHPSIRIFYSSRHLDRRSLARAMVTLEMIFLAINLSFLARTRFYG